MRPRGASLLFPLLSFFTAAASANGVLVSDGSLADTQAKLNQIAATGQDGWVLTVGSPGGAYTWSSPLQISLPVSVTVQGAGTASPDTRPTVTVGSNAAIIITARQGKVVRVSNFRFQDTGSPAEVVSVVGWSSTPSWRIDNCRFDDISLVAIQVGRNNTNAGGPGPYGLIDHNVFQSQSNHYNGVYLHAGNDSKSWTSPHTFGTDQTIVVEDNLFNNLLGTVPGRPAIDSSYNGVRWLFRYNTLNNWVAVLHGADSAPTSTLQFEFNHNTIRVNDGSDYALYIRGGTGVATGNNIGVTGNATNRGYNSAFKMVRDGPCPNGYPCFQQVGRGVVNGAEGSVPVYIWGNVYDPGRGYNGQLYSAVSDIQLNRDFFLIAKPGYTELAYPHALQSSSAPPPEVSLAPPANVSVVVQ